MPKTWGLGAAIMLALGGANMARAEWHRIETVEFALQADMEPDALQATAALLLDHDRMLRAVLGVTGEGRGRRVEIFIHGDHARLVTEAGLDPDVSGFFHTTPIENFALMPASDSRENRHYSLEATLRHEYTHYFVRRHLGHQYPPWFTEGIASFFETAHRGAGPTMVYGSPPEQMLYALQETGGLTFDELSTMQRFPPGSEQMVRFNAQGWMITSHYYLGGSQAPGIEAYLAASAKGLKADPTTFAGGASQLDSDVRAWFDAGLPAEKEVAIVPADPAALTARALTPGELALFGLRLEMYRRFKAAGSTEEARATGELLLRSARALVKDNGDDPAVRNYVAKLLLMVDNGPEATEEIAAFVPATAEDIDGRILRARLMSRQAGAGPPARFDRTIAAARAALQSILRTDPDNVDALYGLFENHRIAEGASPKAIQYLSASLDVDPANDMWRDTLLELHLRSGRLSDAIELLQPIANMPHGGQAGKQASRLIAEIRKHM